jgi:His/Glu/Gln/Arg/opine family amino acid ABC transporter permease subunit
MMALTAAVILVVMFLVPPIINAAFRLPSYFVGAGSGIIELGTISAVPNPRLAFTGRANEEIHIRIASDLAASDQSLTQVAGFVDNTTITLRNAAQNRLDAIARQAALQAILDGDASSDIPQLTEGLRANYSSELEAIVIPDVVVETYQINQTAIEVSILDAKTLQPIAETGIVASAEDELVFTLPAEGWYILQAVPASAVAADANVFTVLDVHGIYPVMQSANYDASAGQFVDTYVRMTDDFRVVEPVPQIDGQEVPFVLVTRNQYRGARTESDWLRTYLSPFLQRISVHTAIVIAFTAAGYGMVAYLESQRKKALAQRIATLLLLLLPLVVWVLVNGMSQMTALLWLAVIGLIVYCVLLYRLGKAQGKAGWWQAGKLPMISVLVIAGYAACLLLYVNAEKGGLPHTVLVLGFIPLLASALSGTLSHIPQDEVKVDFQRLLAIAAVLFLIPLGLIAGGIVKADTLWLLSESDTRNWGGLLLTMMLTLYGIIVAFPIGVGLALGRRSSLPAVRYICTSYIELVRGSPFVTVLFFMQLLIPLINQGFAEVPNSYRAMIATIAFSAAYLAENVRGGLQSLPPGQSEAAKALGLNAWQMTVLITLPQALRAVIPVLVGQFIGLFKDTSLVAIVGLIDLTGFVNSMAVQAEFIGTRLEGLFFISLIYFSFSYFMGYISRLLEASGSGSTRRM